MAQDTDAHFEAGCVGNPFGYLEGASGLVSLGDNDDAARFAAFSTGHEASAHAGNIGHGLRNEHLLRPSG